MTTILKINSSIRYEDSVSRQLTDKVVQKISTSTDTIINRDLNKGMYFINERNLTAARMPEQERSREQHSFAKMADILIEELQQADIIVIGAPVYNFGPPASLKAWADLVARPNVTFKKSEQGNIGLLKNKKAYLVGVSGGIEIEGDSDFMMPWLTFFLGFIGIKEIEMIVADGIYTQDGKEKIKKAYQNIETLTK